MGRLLSALSSPVVAAHWQIRAQIGSTAGFVSETHPQRPRAFRPDPQFAMLCVNNRISWVSSLVVSFYYLFLGFDRFMGVSWAPPEDQGIGVGWLVHGTHNSRLYWIGWMLYTIHPLHPDSSTGFFIWIFQPDSLSDFFNLILHPDASSGFFIQILHPDSSSGCFIRILHPVSTTGFFIRIRQPDL